MSILFDEKVENYLNELADFLYKEEYFCHKSFAYDYVGWIIDSIVRNISTTPYKVAPHYFSRYGKDLYYSVFLTE